MGTNNLTLWTWSLTFFLKNLKLANNFWTVSSRIWCFTWVPTIVTLTLEFDLLFENFNNIWIVCAKALIFHMSIFSIKTFLWVPTFLTLWPWSSGLHFEYFDPVNKIWIVSARALIFHMNIACDKIFVLVLNLFSIGTFPWVPTFLTLWPWSWSLVYVLNTLTLLIKFE